jgi:alpha-glucan,water dikinase
MGTTFQSETTFQLAEGITVTQQANGKGTILTIHLARPDEAILHWGLNSQLGGAWTLPPEKNWPQGTKIAGAGAVRTPFSGNGHKQVTIHLDTPTPWRGLSFVVYSPKENRWIKSGGSDFVVPLPRGGRSPEEALTAWQGDEPAARQTFALDGGDRLAVAMVRAAARVQVRFVCDAAGPLALHWGLAWRFQSEWQIPTESYRPRGTVLVNDKAAEIAFTEKDGLQYLEMVFTKPTEEQGPRGLRFVLRQAENVWLKSGGSDLFVALFEPERDRRFPTPRLAELAEQIVSVETCAGSWTLMHRFNLCHDLLANAENDEDALALLFAWLRFSAIRQLDWQRNYNTKPRELSHAQDRLTARLAGVWRSHSADSHSRFWARQMFTTLGRGGEGQRVRDEILHIMHRNNIKEMAGHFIEEWHQKLHNNTTPDDVAICQAYLAFLRSNGDTATFYRTLEAEGVSRARLESFERPIKSAPTFFAGRKEVLIGEFENFLKILKSVHSGTDLESAVSAARGRLDGAMNQQLDRLLQSRGKDSNALSVAREVATVRANLSNIMSSFKDDTSLRDLLFLDLALEDCLRSAIERQNVSRLTLDELEELIRFSLQNLNLTVGSQELSFCAGHWEKLLALPRDKEDWPLRALSVSERVGRWVAEFTHTLYQRLQPKAEALGGAFQVEKWTIPLFSEDVIRGGPAFALSLLLRPLERLLREAAGLGGWQVVSSAHAAGKVHCVQRLHDVQSERFADPIVLIADEVSGDEEIPEGVKAVLSAATLDLVAHLAVRARNAGVLFATCFDAEEYQRLKSLTGKTLALSVSASGDVQYAEGEAPIAEVGREEHPSPPSGSRPSPQPSPSFVGWVIGQDEFKPGVVGAKSLNLNGLRGRLPDWIHFPKSIAVPFGILERVLAEERNRRLKDECEELLARAGDNPSPMLAAVREKVMKLSAPTELQAALNQQWLRAGLPFVAWEPSWQAIRRVWASKWNDRAYLSRRARRVPHDSLYMAVLIQEVVPADYAFVLHTANTLTGDHDELFGEIVLGMGESLVGNYAGRALGFVCHKSDLKPRILSYPSKKIGIYGKGVIFRSDSNGEDLEGFAGAGLYDSYLAEAPEHRLLDYRNEKLEWDYAFREERLRCIARAGVEVERLLGTAQDIEGAVIGGRLYVVQTRPQVGL